ncbi:hypothetical protein SFR_3600 [Streptomyces sp. FR-008]|nr:hypothetical protein SFR_3600 [Streptomyces sp. FR-008]
MGTGGGVGECFRLRCRCLVDAVPASCRRAPV